MRAEGVDFRNDRGWRLAGRLLLPESSHPPLVLFAHGLGSSKDSPRNLVVATRLVDAGLGALLFDLSGHGQSEGDAQAPLEQFAADVAAAARFASGLEGVEQGGLGISGSSLGATAALYAAVALAVPVRTLVLRAPPLDGYERLLARLPAPTLIIAGGADPLLPALRQASGSLPPGSRLQVIPGASHLFEGTAALEAMVKATVDWFAQRLAPAPEPQAQQAEAQV